MKKIFIFLLLTTIVFASNNRISNINDIYTEIKETVYLNGDKKIKEYNIEYISPDYMRKEITLPKVNKGEIFQYENGVSLVYIPLFNEVNINKSDDDASNFLSIVNDLKNKDNKDELFRNNYYSKRVKELKFKENFSIQIKEYKVINGYLFPIKMDILEKDTKIAELELKNTKINSGLNRKELKK